MAGACTWCSGLCRPPATREVVAPAAWTQGQISLSIAGSGRRATVSNTARATSRFISSRPQAAFDPPRKADRPLACRGEGSPRRRGLPADSEHRLGECQRRDLASVGNFRGSGERGQRAKGRGQRAIGRGPRSKGRGPRAIERGQRAKGRGQRAKGRGPRAIGRGPRAIGRGQRAKGRGPRAIGRGPRAIGRGPRAIGRDPRAIGRGPRAIGRSHRLDNFDRVHSLPLGTSHRIPPVPGVVIVLQPRTMSTSSVRPTETKSHVALHRLMLMGAALLS